MFTSDHANFSTKFNNAIATTANSLCSGCQTVVLLQNWNIATLVSRQSGIFGLRTLIEKPSTVLLTFYIIYWFNVYLKIGAEKCSDLSSNWKIFTSYFVLNAYFLFICRIHVVPWSFFKQFWSPLFLMNS